MSCVGCAYYSDLKEPRVQKHKEGFVYAIRGYCFYGVSRSGYNMGTAVLIPEGTCGRFQRSGRENEEHTNRP